MGAPQTRLWELANAFLNKGWRVEVIAAMPNYPTGNIFPKYGSKWSLNETIGDIPVHRSWIYASNSKRSIPRILSMLSFSLSIFTFLFRARRFRPDIVMVESPPLLLGFFGHFFVKMIRSKLWFNVSDLWPLTAKEMGVLQDGNLYRFLLRLEKFIYRKSWIVSGQSEEITSYTSKINPRSFLVRNGADVAFFNRFVRRAEKQGPIRIVYAGLFGVAQGVFDIVKNGKFKENNLEFHLYGDGPEKELIKGHIDGDQKESSIFYHGSVEREKIPGILNEYDVYLIPLKYQIYGAVPSKLYEAMVTGLPIIFFASGEGAQIVQDHNLGWTCSPGDFSGLNKILDAIAGGRESLEGYYENNRSVAVQNFNREKIYEQTEERIMKEVS